MSVCLSIYHCPDLREARQGSANHPRKHCLRPHPPGSCLWNLKDFLPPALQDHLSLLLAEFMYRPWKEAAAAALKGATQGGSQAVADAQQAQDVQVGGAAGLCVGSLSSGYRSSWVVPPRHPITGIIHQSLLSDPLSSTHPPSQVEYLIRELGGAWGDRLMTKVQAFASKVPPGSSHPECQFPVLAGSHLSEVSGRMYHNLAAPEPPSCLFTF
jgi:hypothetical protein